MLVAKGSWSRRGWLLVVCLLCVGPWIGESASAAKLPMPFCKQNQVLRDYLEPLSQVPRGAGFANSGRLKVGPSVLRIYPPKENIVAINKGRFEVRAQVEGRRHQSQSLNWQVNSRLERINTQGKRVGPLKEKRQHVSDVGSFGRRDFGFSGRVSAGFYRLTIEIKNKGGTRLARYQELFRALPARSNLRLTASFTTLSPGETGYLRVDNLGTVPAGYGVGYSLINDRGEEVPVEAIFPNIMLKISAGYAGSCFSFKAPVHVTPGEYRIQAEAGDALRPFGPLSTSVTIR